MCIKFILDPNNSKHQHVSFRDGGDQCRCKRNSLFLPMVAGLIFVLGTWCQASAEEPLAFQSEYGAKCIALSPDGKLLAMFGSEGLRIADPRTGKVLRNNTQNTPDIVQVAWFPDGKRLLTHGEGFHIWDANTLKMLANVPTADFARAAAVAPDEKWIAVGQPSGDILLIDLQTKRTTKTLKGHSQHVNTLVWSKRGDKLFSAGGYNDPTIRTWNTQTGQQTGSIKVDVREVAWFAISADETWLAAQGSSEVLTTWDIATGKKLKDFPGTSFAKRVAISPDGKTMASSHENDVVLFDTQGKPMKKLQGHNNWVSQVQFSSDGQLLVTSGGNSVLVWKTDAARQNPEAYSKSGQETVSLSTDNAIVQHVAFSPNGRWLTAAVDTEPAAQIYVWNTETLELHAKVAAGSAPLLDAHFRLDSKLLYQHSNGDFVVWEAGRKKEMRRFKLEDASSAFGISRGPNHVLAMGNGRGEILLANGLTGETLRRIAAHPKPVRSADITPDGKLVASGSQDYTAKIWNAQTGKLVDTLPTMRGSYQVVGFSPDGTLLAGGSEEALVLWDVTGRKLKFQTPGHSTYTRCLTFSRDGHWLITGGDDRLVKVWDVSTGKLLATLTGHTDSVFGVSISPDNKRIASGSFDKTVKLWNVAKFMK